MDYPAADLTAARGVQVYIDEAQDFSPAELALLISVAGDPAGVTIAGDTAQTINPGSAFSFREVREAYQKEGLEFPGSCTLSTNFRSASGIVKAGNRLIELLQSHFPGSIDFIQEDPLPLGLQSAAIATEFPPIFVHAPRIREVRWALSASNDCLARRH